MASLLWLAIGVSVLALVTLLPPLVLAALLRRIARPGTGDVEVSDEVGADCVDATPPGWGQLIPLAASGPLRLEPEPDRSSSVIADKSSALSRSARAVSDGR